MIQERAERLRLKRKLTHQDMAVKLGVTRQAYSNYESGKRKPDNETLSRIADLLGTSTDYLLGRTDQPDSIYHEKDPLLDPRLNLFFKDWDKLSPERQEEVKAFIRAQLLLQDAEEQRKKE